MSSKKPDVTELTDVEQALDEQALDQVSGGASRVRGSAGELAAIYGPRRKTPVSGGDDDLKDLEVER